MRDRVVVCNSGISSDTVRPDEHAARFAVGCFVFGCLLTLHPSVEMVSAICFCPYLEIPLITQMQAFHACATRRCRSQARDLLSQPLWRCLRD